MLERAKHQELRPPTKGSKKGGQLLRKKLIKTGC